MNFDLTDEQKAWKKTVHDFVAKEVQPKAHEVDLTYEFNWPAVRKMGPLGLLSLNIPEEYGGADVDAVSAAIAIEEIGWRLRLDRLVHRSPQRTWHHSPRPTSSGWAGPRSA